MIELTQQEQDYWKDFWSEVDGCKEHGLRKLLVSNFNMTYVDAIDVVYNLSAKELEEALQWAEECMVAEEDYTEPPMCIKQYLPV